MAKAHTEIIRRVWLEGEPGGELTIGPDCDGLGMVRLHTEGKKAEEYFSKIDLVLDPEVARQVGLALIAAAEEVN
jgi:hypothetical protein